MADFSESKGGLGEVLPENAVQSDWARTEPLVTPSDITNFYLWGIPLVAAIKDPFTNKPAVMTPEILKGFIEKAVTKSESDLKINIFPIQFNTKFAFDRCDYEAMGYVQLPQRPVTFINKMAVVPSNGIEVYEVPLDWIETAYLMRGQIYLMPITIAIMGGGFVPSQSSGGAVFLSIMGQRSWIPAFWQINYTCGFIDGKVPKVVNQYIATVCSMNILSQLAATYARSTSYSLGVDGLSQSTSLPGPEIFTTRFNQLNEDRKELQGKLKHLFGIGLGFTNV